MAKATHQLSYGLYALGVKSSTKENMCIINTAVQVASKPPALSVAVSKDNYTNELIASAQQFNVTILKQDIDLNTIARFGFATGRTQNKFEGFADYAYDTAGNPYLTKDGLAMMSIRLSGSVDMGSHTIFYGEIVEQEVYGTGEPLTYAYYRAVKNGTTPKNAPSYDENTAQPSGSAPAYRCQVCGYIYDGPIPFEQLDEDWRCPVCSAPKKMFTLV